MNKLTLTAAAAVGYVLGARAGRQRFEQIAATARRVSGNPRVQKVTSNAQNVATQKVRQAVPVVKEKVADAARTVKPSSGSPSESSESSASSPAESSPTSSTATSVTPPVSPRQPATSVPTAGLADDSIGGPA